MYIYWYQKRYLLRCIYHISQNFSVCYYVKLNKQSENESMNTKTNQTYSFVCYYKLVNLNSIQFTVHVHTDKWLQPSFFLYKTETACIEFHRITSRPRHCRHAWISVDRMDTDFFFFGPDDILAVVQFGGIFSAWRSNPSLFVSVILGTNWWKTCLLGCQSKEG